ncbi:MFS transporter [Arthrobacter sp. SAFR-044]|uniref:MFS transporter n=1 Tax=Arthrobacter sp. SAFR-044 TaxID=3387278 RepID=UPI003F7B3B93
MSTQTEPAARMTRNLAVLFAIAGGVAVGNLYWAQPLLELIGHDFGLTASGAGLIVTLTQIGYALGVLLLVPLGDVLRRSRLIPALMAVSALALLGAALAPGYGVLLVMSAAIGITTVSGQLLTPLTGDLADHTTRGRMVGIVTSGLLIGILASRTVSGLIAGVAGWQAIFFVAAALTAVIAVVLWRVLPEVPAKTSLAYPALIGSVFVVVARHRAVRWTLPLGACGFASFTMFWTVLTFQLSAAPLSLDVTQIGLVGLAGLVGALAAQRAGRLSDRGWSIPATGIAWVAALIAWVIAGFAPTSLIGLLVAVIVLDVAVQGQNLLNQVRLFETAPEARSRVNTAFVFTNFVAGAIGSAAGSALYVAGGWALVCAAGAVIAGIALSVWAIGRTTGAYTTNPAHP